MTWEPWTIGILMLFSILYATRPWERFKRKPRNSFQYLDRVQVTDGFYKGCVGDVNAEVKSRYYDHKYEIGILVGGKVEKYVWIEAKYLEEWN